MQCSPSILFTKPKFHFLVHLPLYIRRFGPCLLFSTERYESFNTVFRLCSILSNRQSPSRDIANTFAYQDTVKHIVTAGCWWDKVRGSWVRAGDGVISHISNHPEHARLVGIAFKPERTIGE